MKKVIIVLALMTSACSVNKVLESAPVIGDVCTAAQGTLIDEKVVYAAEVLYNIPAHAYVTADQSGKFEQKLELKATLKALLIKLDGLRRSISAAKGSVNCDFNSMKELQVQIVQLLPRN